MESLAARWWQPVSSTKQELMVQCNLCVHNCRIPMGRAGYCTVRFNEEGTLIAPYLGQFIAIAIDPIEKKPLYHWMPGTQIFSLGSIGCTMRCPFCQNHDIAQPAKSLSRTLQHVSIQSLVDTIKKLRLPSVAFTYNEPTLQAEYIIKAGPALREAGIAVALITNCMIQPEPLEELLPWIDALNIDLKTFNASVYKKLGGSLDCVRQNISRLVQAGKHIELTTLVVPGVSDDLEEFTAQVDWIASLSPEIPLHLSRYFPAHKYTTPMTPIELLQEMQDIAKTRLHHVHIGNVR